MRILESFSRFLLDMPVVRRMRVGPRIAVNEQVLVREAGDDSAHVALLRDLSIGGACIRSDLRLRCGDELWLRAFAGPGEEFEFGACVVTVRSSDLGFFADYGLRLVKLDLASARLLADFIDRRLAKGGL